MNLCNKLFIAINLMAITLLPSTTNAQSHNNHYSLKEIWATPKVLEAPESVIYHKASEKIYVSSISGKPAEENGHGFISKLSKDGKVEELKWVTGLNAPKGMGIYGNLLYVADVNTLVEIDIKQHKIINHYPIKNALFLNDVTVDEKGNVYTSDSRGNKIHVLKNGAMHVWLEDAILKGPNGLHINNNHLWIGCQDFLLKVNMSDKKQEVYAKGTSDIDGLEMVEENTFLFSNWVGRIMILDSNKGIINLMDSSKEEIQSADITYIPETKTVLVPTFFDNRVVAYQLTKAER